MTIATLRRDGWPQATVVSYANEGFVLYTIIGRNTQKYLNIVRDRACPWRSAAIPRVSVAISSDLAQPLQYKGLSLGGHATVVENSGQIERFRAIVLSAIPSTRISAAGSSDDRGSVREARSRVDHRLFQGLRSFRPGADFAGSAGRIR